MSDYFDHSMPPVGDQLIYTRGDGAKVELKISTSDTEVATTRTVPTPVQPSWTPPRITMHRQQLEGRNKGAAEIPVARQPGHGHLLKNPQVFDHPDVGGKFTVCVLFYGPEEYLDLHRRCIEGIVASVPADRLDLRVASNQLNQQSAQMLRDLVKQGVISRYYEHAENRFKYPVMREMFFDPDHPITTKWVVWFDDDSIVRDPSWVYSLASEISRHHKDGQGAHMLGAKFIWTTTEKQRTILASRPWYKNRPWRTKSGAPAPNGDKILFAAGGFWAITYEAIVAADIPDLGTGLTHNGGDWQIGEQLYQSGFELKQYNGKKQFITTSSVPRRGVTAPLIDKQTMGPPPPPPKQVTVATPAAAPLRIPSVIPIQI